MPPVSHHTRWPEAVQPLTKRIEKCFRGQQIGGLEPFCEPPVDGGQHFARLGGPALPMVEPCKARRASQLPRESVLASGAVESLLEAFLRVGGVGRASPHEEQ